MFDGRLTRLAILCLLLLAPVASAVPPNPRGGGSDNADGQDITDLAVDPSGQFMMAVVAFDSAKATTGLPLGGGSTSAHDDVYRCDYGAPGTSSSGSGCRGLRHDSGAINPLVQPANAPQRVAVGVPSTGGAVFYVAGPERYVSRWTMSSDLPSWTKTTEDNHPIVNITSSRDGERVVVATAPTTPTAGGRIESRWGANGSIDWFIALQNPEGATVRPTSLDYSRAGGVLAIGTTDMVLFADPAAPRPSGTLGALQQADSVNDVALASLADGRIFVAAGASNGVFFAELVRDGGKIVPKADSVVAYPLGESVQRVTISVDGSYFAAAAGSKVHIYRRLETFERAVQVGTAYDAGARVNDLAYDQKGQVLVAVSGNRVLGFGPNKATPVWNFDATTSAFGSLDGPLRDVAVSDDGQRIVVAGKTKMMAYNSLIAVTSSVASATGATSMQPTQTMQLVISAKNTGSLSDNYSFSVVAPIGWTATGVEPLRLDPDESDTVRFNVSAPAGQAPGVYAVQVRVRSQAHEDFAARRGVAPSPQYVTTPSFNITIPRSVVLKVEAPEPPNDRVQLRQGAETSVPVVLRNEGNADGIVNLSTAQQLTRGASWDLRFSEGDQVVVPASGTKSVTLVVRAPADSGSGDRNVITIRAREGDTVEATDQITAYVDAQWGAELKTNRTTWEFYPGQVQTITLNVTNIGNTEDVYNLTQSVTPAAVQNDWRVTIDTPQVTVQRGETKRVTVTVKAVASDAREATLNLVAQSQNAPDKKETQLILNLMTIPRPPTEEDNKLLPAPGALAALLVVATLALALRRGGRP